MTFPQFLLILFGAGSFITLIVVIWCVVTYNRLVATRNHIRDSWGGVEVELQRRYDLIPNLIETVRGYAAHERAVFERVAEARTRAMSATGDANAKAACEPEFLGAVGSLIAVAEAYPELKADRHFSELQDELTHTEDRIAAARRFYNGNVRTHNQLVEMVPSNLIAGRFGFTSQSYFEVQDHAAQYAPKVSRNG